MKAHEAFLARAWLGVFFLCVSANDDLKFVVFQQPTRELKMDFISNNPQKNTVEIQVWAQPLIPAHDDYYTEVGFKIDNSAWHYAEVNYTQKVIAIEIKPNENCTFTIDGLDSVYHKLNITECANFETLTLLPSHVSMQRVAVLYQNLVHVMWDFTNQTLIDESAHSEYTAISVVANASESWFYGTSLSRPQWHATASDRLVLRRNNYHAEGNLFSEHKNRMRFDDSIHVCSVASHRAYFEFQCAQGYFRSAETDSCTPCQQGKYKDKISDDTECEPCQYPYGTTREGSEACDLCEAGKNVINGVCTACVPGKYKDSDREIECIECPAGTYSTETGATLQSACMNCSRGMYSNRTGAISEDTCLPCAIGSYAVAPGQSVCALCSQGASTIHHQTTSKEHCVCDVGFYTSDSDNLLQCMACQTGRFNDEKNRSSCTLCSKGKYQSQQGQSTCINCQTTQFSAPGSTECSNCPDNAGSKTGGLEFSTECACNPGFFLNNTIDTCTPCHEGSYKATYNNASCTLCANSTFQNVSGQSTCKNCTAGRWSLQGGTTCKECGANAGGDQPLSNSNQCRCKPGFKVNTSTEGHSLQDCEPCGAGFFGKGFHNRESCTPCSIGKFSSALSAVSESDCQSCQDGQYAPLNSSSCLPCKGNSTSNDKDGTHDDCECNRGYAASGAWSCVACASGKYKDEIADIACIKCPAGTHMPYQAAESASECRACSDTQYAGAGSESCTNCPNHSHSLSPRKTSQDCYCNAGYNGANGEVCVACKEGSYKSLSGHHPCLSCSSGKYSDAIAATSSTTCITCPEAHYADFRSPNCSSCPPHSDTWSSRRYKTDCKCNRGYRGSDGGPCEACPHGTFKMRIGDAACVECQTGSITTKTGTEYASECVSCSAGMEPNPWKSNCEYSSDEIAM